MKIERIEKPSLVDKAKSYIGTEWHGNFVSSLVKMCGIDYPCFVFDYVNYDQCKKTKTPAVGDIAYFADAELNERAVYLSGIVTNIDAENVTVIVSEPLTFPKGIVKEKTYKLSEIYGFGGISR